MMTFDCARCGRLEVKPVHLSDGRAYGRTCALRAMGVEPSHRALVKLDGAAFLAEQAEGLRQERRDRAAAIIARSAATGEHVTDCARELEPMGLLRTYHLGHPEGMTFPAYLCMVAETGELG